MILLLAADNDVPGRDPRAVRVTIDVNGQVVDIATTSKLDDMRPQDIGPAVLACIRKAQQTLVTRFAAVAQQTMGEDPMGADLVE